VEPRNVSQCCLLLWGRINWNVNGKFQYISVCVCFGFVTDGVHSLHEMVEAESNWRGFWRHQTNGDGKDSTLGRSHRCLTPDRCMIWVQSKEFTKYPRPDRFGLNSSVRSAKWLLAKKKMTFVGNEPNLKFSAVIPKTLSELFDPQNRAFSRGAHAFWTGW
jgi:hypothetical protein